MIEIVGCTLEVLREKRCRRDSIRNKKWDLIHEAIETTARKIKKVARRGSLLGGRRGSLLGDSSPVIVTTKYFDQQHHSTSRRGSLAGDSVALKSLDHLSSRCDAVDCPEKQPAFQLYVNPFINGARSA